NPEDVEAGDHRGLGPTQLLEMMVQWCHAEYAMAVGVFLPLRSAMPLVDRRLQDHRYGLRGKDTADDEQKELGLEEDRHRAEGAPDRNAAGVSHEDLGGMGVEPEEAEARPHERGAEYRELTGPREIEEIEKRSEIGAAQDVGKDRKCQRRNRRQPGGESIQAVGQVDRVAAAGNDGGYEEDEEPGRKVHHQVFEERQGGGGGGQCRFGDDRLEEQQQAKQDAEAALAHELPLGHQPPRLPLHDLEIIVDEPDGAHPQHREQRHQHEAIVQLCPQQGRHYRRDQDDEPAHRRRAPLALMTGRALGADHLPHLVGLQPPDDGRTHHEREQQRGDRGPRRPKADVVEKIEYDPRLAERGKQVVEHQSSVGGVRPAVRYGSIRSSATPRDALSTTSSFPSSRLARIGPSATGSGAVRSRSPSSAACGASAGTNSPTTARRSGLSCTSWAAAPSCRAAACSPSSRIVPATKTSRRPWRMARAVAMAEVNDCGLAL